MLEHDIDFRILASALMFEILKGTTLCVGKHTYTCTGVIQRDRYIEIRIKRDDNCTARIYRFADHHCGFENYKPSKKQFQANELLREIESQLLLDVLNINNQFHQLSGLFFMAYKAWKCSMNHQSKT